MIYALNDQNERINASEVEKGKSYYCPNLDCDNRELILKKGYIRIPHFAHKSLKDCSSEPESENHILCKKYFQSLLDLDDEFVEYYGIEGVRPDVLYGKFSIEIQCSPITVKEIKRRNKIYEKNGYIAIWIFLEDVFTSIKKTEVPREKSEREKKLERHGIRTEVPIESKLLYCVNYRIKKPVLRGSFEDIGRRNFKFFSFKCENEEIHVNFKDYVDKFSNEFTKQNELVINTRQDFDSILEEILILIKNKKELHDLKKKLNSLPKQIQGNLYESANLNYAHISAWDFSDSVNNFNIGMFLDEIFREKDSPMELFKEYIENMIIEASTKGIKIKEWRDRNTFEKDGKKHIPLCRLNKIYHETLKGYLVWSDQWIPKSISYKDKKYLYCEEWMYKRIENGFKEK